MRRRLSVRVKIDRRKAIGLRFFWGRHVWFATEVNPMAREDENGRTKNLVVRHGWSQAGLPRH